MNIRPARLDDLSAIVHIYNQSIPSRQSTGDTELVKVEDRKKWFEEHLPNKHPIFVAEVHGQIAGWCSLSAYRPGRMALRFTAEISYYIASEHQRKGVGKALVKHALAACLSLQIKNVIAIILERNLPSQMLLEKMGFEKWGHLPNVVDFDGDETGHLYYGRRVPLGE